MPLYIIEDKLLKKQGTLAHTQSCCPYCPDGNDVLVQSYIYNGMNGSRDDETFGQEIKCYWYAQGQPFNSIWRMYLYMSAVTIKARPPSCNSIAFDVSCRTGLYRRRIPDLSGGDEMIGPEMTYWQGVLSTPCDEIQGGEVELSYISGSLNGIGDPNNGYISVEYWNGQTDGNDGCYDTDWAGPPHLELTFAP
jgi:hypothetical protein